MGLQNKDDVWTLLSSFVSFCSKKLSDKELIGSRQRNSSVLFLAKPKACFASKRVFE